MRVIRIYDKDGNHTLSLVDDNSLCPIIDLATPDGDVHYCGIPEELFLLFGLGLDIESV